MTSDNSDARFFFDSHMEAADLMPLGEGVAAVISQRCPDSEGENEDAAAVIPVGDTGGILVVADGMGGHSAGAEAARLAIEAIAASARGRAPEEELRTAILNGFEMANETVRAMAVGAGTTLAVVEIQGQWIRCYHVGDSGIVVTGQRGRIRTRTVDHTPAGYGVEAGLLNEAEAIHHEERHLLSNMVGASDMRIEIGTSIQLAARDTVVMASDGLFDNMMFDAIVDEVRVGPIAAAVEEIARTSRRRMRSPSPARPSKPDDLTVVAYRRNRS